MRYFAFGMFRRTVLAYRRLVHMQVEYPVERVVTQACRLGTLTPMSETSDL